MQEAQYIKIDEYGNKFYHKDKAMKILHRLDGPAYESANGNKLWYVDGKHLSEDECKQQTAVKETVLTLDKIAAKFGVDVKTLKIVKEP